MVMMNETGIEKITGNQLKWELFTKRFIQISIIIAWGFLTVAGGAATDYMDSFTFNTSEVPVYKSIYQNITLEQNATLYISRIDNDTRMDVAFPSETFYDGPDLETIIFNVTIESQFFQNTTLIALFNLSSDATNNTYIYSIIADAVYDESIMVFQGEYYLTLMNGDFKMNITTDLLPRQGALQYKVSGPYGTYMNITCPEGWLSCPANATFNSDNLSLFEVGYLIPSSAELGFHNHTMTFTTGNVSRSTIVTFNVKKPEYTFEKYVFEDRCFKKSEDGQLLVTYDCMIEKQEHDNTRFYEMIDYLKAEYSECNYSYEEPETQYVLRGDLEEAIWIPYQSCIKDVNSTRDELEKCRHENDVCVSERKTCLSDLGDERELHDKCKASLMNNESTCLANTFSTAVDYKLEAEKIKKSVIWTVLTIIGAFVLTCLIVWYLIHLIKHHDKEELVK